MSAVENKVESELEIIFSTVSRAWGKQADSIGSNTPVVLPPF